MAQEMCVRCGLRFGQYVRDDGRVCKACYQKERRADAREVGVCSFCGAQFTPTRTYSSESGRAVFCSRECKTALRVADGRAAESARKHYYSSRYGLTLTQAEQLREAGCAICGSQGKDGRWGNLHIDHDHQTGVVRGALCTNCNTGLGKFREDPDLLDTAAAYLRG